MNEIINIFSKGLSLYVSKDIVIFLISMCPILELRGGLLASKILGISLLRAIPICIIGNIIPIPFILLFIKKIFVWMKKIKIFKGFIEKIENRAMKKSASVKEAEFWGLLLFVGIPIPGTGAWMGSLIAALLDMDLKKALVAELLGVIVATILCAILFYGLLGMFI